LRCWTGTDSVYGESQKRARHPSTRSFPRKRARRLALRSILRAARTFTSATSRWSQPFLWSSTFWRPASPPQRTLWSVTRCLCTPHPLSPMRRTAYCAQPELNFLPGRSAARGLMMSSRGRSPFHLSSQPIQMTMALHDDERCESKSPVGIGALATSSTPAFVRRSRPSQIQVFAGRSQRKRTSRSPVRMSSSLQIRQVPRAGF